jgi:hypothetical protein
MPVVITMKNPNTLVIRRFEFEYTPPGQSDARATALTDFVIDDEPLGRSLDLWTERPWFGRTGFDDTDENIGIFMQELVGARPARNQWGTNRLVLFRCHCGCDYCGIVSCDAAADEKFIRWRDIRGEEWPASTMVDLTFDRSQYVDAIEDFARQTFPTSDIVCAALTLVRKNYEP